MARRNLRRGGADPIVVGTGGSRRIGLEICCQLAARGAYVVLTARKPAAGAAAVKKLAARQHRRIARFFAERFRPPRRADRQCRHYCQRQSARAESRLADDLRHARDERAGTVAPGAKAHAVAQARDLPAHGQNVERHGRAGGQ